MRAAREIPPRPPWPLAIKLSIGGVLKKITLNATFEITDNKIRNYIN